MGYDNFRVQIENATDSATLLAVSEAFMRLANELQDKAARLEQRRNREGRDLLTYLRSGQYALELNRHGIEDKKAIALAAIRYNTPEATVAYHFERKKMNEELERTRARNNAAKEMARRGLSQRAIARKLGITQPRVSQLIKSRA